MKGAKGGAIINKASNLNGDIDGSGNNAISGFSGSNSFNSEMVLFMIIERRKFLSGLVSLIAAPAIVRVTSLMPVKAFELVTANAAVSEITEWHWREWGKKECDRLIAEMINPPLYHNSDGTYTAIDRAPLVRKLQAMLAQANPVPTPAIFSPQSRSKLVFIGGQQVPDKPRS